MLDNKYIKHPYHCNQCNALTPHLAVNASGAQSKAESEKKQWKLGVLMEYLMTLLFKDDHNVPGFYVDSDYEYQCEKCGTKSWH
ncbi:hypothetical protein AB4354_01930 [Vibrio splendidus]|uniref:hypothetical protein n=1 Tax=Vibrio splendidus TaxID=29497 RepID=UPI00097538A5|nr:hypothetical protein [Vibrio splendidus]OMO22490.1 hypothetical protein BH581_21860 [Vibrio splendidus]PMH02985.1 hypothetical protein BCU75_04870 [Vibrio splendidus]PMI79704.1 hypothetical protein BCU37_18125 [Vibrio splendidus]PMK60058.1 hypothetical protein BCT96_14975 [Vibrio splendidus]